MPDSPRAPRSASIEQTLASLSRGNPSVTKAVLDNDNYRDNYGYQA